MREGQKEARKERKRRKGKKGEGMRKVGRQDSTINQLEERKTEGFSTPSRTLLKDTGWEE